MERSNGGRRRKEGIGYSCFLTEEFSPQTRKEPDLDKGGRKERVPQLLPIRILSHIIIHSHATRCTHTIYSLPSDACHINLTYMAFSNYDDGNKSSQCVPCHKDELLKGELGQVQPTISSHHTMSQPSPHSAKKYSHQKEIGYSAKQYVKSEASGPLAREM